MDNQTFVFILQVGSCSSLNTKKSCNVCLVVFPSPQVLFSLSVQCFRVLKLLLCGDVEQNLNPVSQMQASQFEEMFRLLTNLNARSVKFEEGQVELIETVSEIKQNQEKVENKILEVSGRLLSVEAKTAVFDKFEIEEELKLNQELIRSTRRKNADLCVRLDDYEDRSRCDNLLFYGVSNLC